MGESLRERLAASPEYAAEYLDAVLEENDPQAFLLALRHVADRNITSLESASCESAIENPRQK